VFWSCLVNLFGDFNVISFDRELPAVSQRDDGPLAAGRLNSCDVVWIDPDVLAEIQIVLWLNEADHKSPVLVSIFKRYLTFKREYDWQARQQADIDPVPLNVFNQ